MSFSKLDLVELNLQSISGSLDVCCKSLDFTAELMEQQAEVFSHQILVINMSPNYPEQAEVFSLYCHQILLSYHLILIFRVFFSHTETWTTTYKAETFQWSGFLWDWLCGIVMFPLAV